MMDRARSLGNFASYFVKAGREMGRSIFGTKTNKIDFVFNKDFHNDVT